MDHKLAIPPGARFDLATGKWTPRQLVRFGFAGADGGATMGENGSFIIRDPWTGGPAGRPQVGVRGRPLSDDERGVILMPPAVRLAQGIEVHNNLDAAELRFSLLLFDRIQSPEVQLIAFGLGHDAKYLMELGLLERSELFGTDDIEVGEGIVKTALLTLASLEERDGPKWSLARGERSLSLWDGGALEQGGALFHLIKAIPIPDREVPIDEILKFKEARRPELIALRAALEVTYARISEDVDGLAAMSGEIARLDEALASQLRISREWQFPFRLTNCKMKIDQKTAAGVTAGVSLALNSGLPLATAALAGIVGAVGFSVSADVGRRVDKISSNPFEYAAAIQNELI